MNHLRDPGPDRPSAAPARTMAVPRLHWILSGAAFVSLGALAMVLMRHAAPNAWWIHGAWCIAGLIVAVPSHRYILSGGIDLVLQDHRVMFVATFSLYFLVGASLLAYGPTAQIALAMQRYPVSVSDALRVDAMNALGMGVALIVTGLSNQSWLGVQASALARTMAGVPLKGVTVVLLAVGMTAYASTLPFDLGQRDGVVSGAVRSIGKLPLVAIMLTFVQRGPRERIWYALGTVIAMGMATIGLLLFSKSEALLPLAALTAGFGIRFGTRIVFPAGLAVLMTGYLLLGNLSLYGRYAIAPLAGASWSMRWQVIREGWAIRREQSEAGESIGWVRLCYLPIQAAGLDLRDHRNGGDGLAQAGWVFVPRLLAPGKPEISKTGRELYAKLTGRETSADGLGIFISGYYHGGWLGLLFASALSGWILARTSAIARSIQRHGGFLLLPMSMLGLFIAFRIDGDIIIDYLGPFVWIVYSILMAAPILALRRQKRTRLKA